MTRVRRQSVNGVFVPIILLLLLLMSESVVAEQSFSVAPGVFTFDLTRTRSDSVALTNTGDERIRLKITATYFPIDSDSMQAGVPLDNSFNNKDDISKRIIVSPRIVVLSPGQKRYVRFSIQLQEELLPGDYRTHLLVRIMDSRKENVAIKEDSAKTDGLSIQLAIRIQTAIAVYGRMGLPDTKLLMSCETDNKNKLLIQAQNGSIWNYRGWIGIFKSEGQDPEQPTELVRLINFRESKRKVSTNQIFDSALVLRWGLSEQQLTDGMQKCSLKQ